MAAKAVRDIPEVFTIPPEGAARGRYCKQLRGYPVPPRRAPYVNLFVA